MLEATGGHGEDDEDDLEDDQPAAGGGSPESAAASFGAVESKTAEQPDVTASAGARITTLAVIHHRFWRLERIADLYFELMNVFPDMLDEIRRFIAIQRDCGQPISSSTHATLLDLLLGSLEPWSPVWASHRGQAVHTSAIGLFYGKWVHQVEYSRAHVLSLMDLIEDAAAVTLLRLRLERLGELVK